MSDVNRPIPLTGKIILFLALAALLFSCAQKPYIPVRYQVPSAEPDRSGKTVALTVIDQRQQKDVLTGKAREKVEFEREAFRLALTSPGEPEKSAGTTDVPAIFREAMGFRVEQLGYTVQRQPQKGAPVLTLALKMFRVDYVEKKWTVEIDYTLSIAGSAARSASQSVRADGERRRVRGRKDLEALLGEVFSDAVNRAEIANLMEKAGLM